jgi:pyruvate formate lyase activating enzyme
MAQCRICNTSSKSISKELSVCLKCIREKPEDSLPLAMQAHKMSRSAFGLPENPPKDFQGLPCKIA